MLVWVYFQDLYPVILVSLSVLYCFDYYSFVIYFEVRGVKPPALFSFKTVFAMKDSLWFHINFRVVFSIS